MLAHMTKAPASRIIYIGRTNHRNSDILFGIREVDRRMHMLIVGKTGTGKTHLLRLMFEQDLRSGGGCALFDPHGDLARLLNETVPVERRPDFIYVDPLDSAAPWRFNPFADVPESHRPLAAAGIVDVFKKLWADDWGPRLEHLLRNVAFTLLDVDGASFADVPQLLADRSFRSDILDSVTNEAVRSFWTEEYANYSTAFRATVIAPLQNKIGVLLTDPILRRFLTGDGKRLNPRKLIDQGKTLVVNLDKGQLGEASSSVLGSLLVSHLALAGLARGDQVENERQDFAIYLDEFQTFTTQALVNMLSELRKYRLAMILSTQYLAAIEPTVLDAVLGNVGTIVSFRVGADDADRLAREFGGPVTPPDLSGLLRYNVFVRLLIQGEPAKAFSASIPESIGRDQTNSIRTH